MNRLKEEVKQVRKKEKKKSTKNGFFQKLSTKLKDVFSGNILVEGLEPSNLKFIFFITGMMVFYIGYGYYVDKTIKQKAQAEEVGAELYSELQSAKELYNQHSLQSKVAEELQSVGLYESVDPPKAIVIKKENENNNN